MGYSAISVPHAVAATLSVPTHPNPRPRTCRAADTEMKPLADPMMSWHCSGADKSVCTAFDPFMQRCASQPTADDAWRCLKPRPLLRRRLVARCVDDRSSEEPSYEMSFRGEWEDSGKRIVCECRGITVGAALTAALWREDASFRPHPEFQCLPPFLHWTVSIGLNSASLTV